MKIEIGGIALTQNIHKLFTRMLKTANKYSKFDQKKTELSINFVDKQSMRDLNKKTRKTDKETDVLSFPNLVLKPMTKIKLKNFKQDINPESRRLSLGDIVICEEVAKENAEKYGHSYERELCYLVLHGFLHLLGFDHMKENDKKIMRALEDAVLKKHKIIMEGE